MVVKRVLIAAAAVVLVATSSAADVVPKGWKTYSDTKNGWSISYPTNFTVNANYVPEGYDGLPIKAVSFDVPASYGKGTNLVTGRLSVETHTGKSCQPAQFFDDTPENIKPLKADGRTYISATFGEGAMMHSYDSHIFVIQGTCLAVRYFTVSTSTGAVEGVKEFDAAKLEKLFDSLRATLKLKSTR